MSLNVVAIHQPNFFPWLGYFDKIAKCNYFIFLDDVQLPKTGGGWSNRVRLIISGKPQWFSVPLNRNFHGVRNINEICFNDGAVWRKKLLKSLIINYGRHPYFIETIELIEFILLSDIDNIADFNIEAILVISSRLGIPNSRFFRSSQLAKEGSSNQLLSTLTISVGGLEYMCGGGADSYQDENVFSSHGLSLVRQNFQHPVYPQISLDFCPGLSVIDIAMNIGWGGVRDLLFIK